MPDETMTNGPARPWGHRAGSARQMFLIAGSQGRGGSGPAALHLERAGPRLVKNEALGAGRLAREWG